MEHIWNKWILPSSLYGYVMSATDIRFVPLSPQLWPAFEALFGPSGACYGCWCTYFRLAPKLRQASSAAERREVMHERVKSGPAPGLLALRGDKAVGWMQIGPRADVPQWNNPGRSSSPLGDGHADDQSVWAVSCFFFAPRERGKGLSHLMLSAGIGFARGHGARFLEASPMDKAKQSKSIGLFVGSTSVFERTGFSRLTTRRPGRPLMRLAL
jgi:GNAT superfamily N-acetyltransferase